MHENRGEQNRQNPFCHGSSILVGETENKKSKHTNSSVSICKRYKKNKTKNPCRVREAYFMREDKGRLFERWHLSWDLNKGKEEVMWSLGASCQPEETGWSRPWGRTELGTLYDSEKAPVVPCAWNARREEKVGGRYSQTYYLCLLSVLSRKKGICSKTRDLSVVFTTVFTVPASC